MNTAIALQLLWQLRRLRQRDRWTRKQLEARQSRALQRLREHAYARSDFYRGFHRGLMDRPLHELPVLTKSLLMEHFDELVTDPEVRLAEVEAHVERLRGEERYLGRYWVNATSGSTGRPGLFLFDRDEWLAVLASFARAHEFAGLQVSLTHRMKMASVASTTPWHMSMQAAASLRSWLMPALRLAASDPLEDIVRQLNGWQPEMLVSYATMARMLAQEQLEGRLRIGPHLIFTSSEVLTEESRRLIERAWGVQPFDQYAATESGGLAAECSSHRGLHVFEDEVILEVVDQDNRPAPPGAYGHKLLITVLSSRTQPLIRYELSDSVRLAMERCPCGRPFALLDGIQGRVEDVLHLAARAGGRVAIHPLVLHRVLDVVPASGWQVVQTPRGLDVLLSGLPASFSDASLADALGRELAAESILIPTPRLRRVSAIPRGPNGKSLLIRRLVPDSAAAAI